MITTKYILIFLEIQTKWKKYFLGTKVAEIFVIKPYFETTTNHCKLTCLTLKSSKIFETN